MIFKDVTVYLLQICSKILKLKEFFNQLDEDCHSNYMHILRNVQVIVCLCCRFAIMFRILRFSPRVQIRCENYLIKSRQSYSVDISKSRKVLRCCSGVLQVPNKVWKLFAISVLSMISIYRKRIFSCFNLRTKI